MKTLRAAAAAVAIAAPILTTAPVAPAAAQVQTPAAAQTPAGRTTASPGTEDSLRRFIAAMQKGAPNYDEMTADLAAAARAQEPGSVARLQALGALNTLTFRRVSPLGMDVYEGEFEKGRVQFAIAPLTADGKVAARSWAVMAAAPDEAALRQHIVDGKPDPAREALLRREIAAEQKGEPDFTIFSPALARVLRQQLAALQDSNRQLGAFKALAFDRVDDRGFDIFTATFENGRVTYRVGPLSADGRLVSLSAQRAPTDAEQAVINARIAAAKPDPERETLLRRVIAGEQAGKLDEAVMAPALLAAARAQWPASQELNGRLGKFRTLAFQNVGDRGEDVYTASYDNGRMIWNVSALTEDHKLQGLTRFDCARFRTGVRLGCHLFLSRTTPAPRDPARVLPRWAAGSFPPPASPPPNIVRAAIDQGGGAVEMTAAFAADGAVQVAVDPGSAPPALAEFCKGLITTPKWLPGTVNGAAQPMRVTYRCATTPGDDAAK